MSSDNFTVQTGNLTDDPDLRFTKNGAVLANFSLAVNTRDGGTWRNGDTPVLPSTSGATRPRTSQIPVQEQPRRGGRAAQDPYLGDLWSDKHHVTQIDATDVAPSLKWAIATPEKAVRARTADRGAECGQFDDEPPF
jgi:single-strand DNA-binding protein